MALAYKKATDANADLTAAIIKTGNVAGVTAAQVKAMALSLDGISHSGAVQVLTQITASGRVAANQF